ncbi:lactadherin-like [Clavelina lepadiformis]|uniref:F5/8 type C domain-containing protein n=1 Tax=Clavelina lepadiformis TaxID=159417 RepID=A0ABP0GTB0_CLALP
MLIYIIICTAVFGVSGQPEICFPVRNLPEDGTLTRAIPGKRGPIGPPGAKGDIGPPGKCICNVDQSFAEMKQMVDLVYKVNLCAVGIKSGLVKDNKMSASSTWNLHTRPYNARLNNRKLNDDRTHHHHGAWLASQNVAGEWIQVDLEYELQVTGVVTQGRPAADQWVTSFKVSFGTAEDQLQMLQDADGQDIIFEGNINRNDYVLNTFPTPVRARFVRLIVMSWYRHISMRLEYLTC